jgi:hypothetical protein
MMAGGGLAFKLSKHIASRPFEMDGLLSNALLESPTGYQHPEALYSRSQLPVWRSPEDPGDAGSFAIRVTAAVWCPLVRFLRC